jgi:hypothetical protein
MGDDLMKRLAPKVAGFFPVIPGETREVYAKRAIETLTKNQRAMIAADIVKVSDEIVAERRVQKAAWIASARRRFFPGPRQSCAICKKYISLTEAHHIVPLSLQEFRWLCPTHHAAEHVIIAALIKTIQPVLEGMPVEERDALSFTPEATRFVELFYQLPRAHWLSKSFRDAVAYMRAPDEWNPDAISNL